MALDETAAAAVAAAYAIRDEYFMNNPVESAGEKKARLAAAIDAASAKIAEAEKDKGADETVLAFLKGKLLNANEAYSAEAEKCLAKVVKLNPKHVEAWNQLGESFFKKGDKNQAKTCFTSALKIERNKVSLCSLSILLRTLPGTQLERNNNVETSLEHAKEAIKLDLADGKSWFVLGNAYLALFFAKMETVEHVRQALKAYKRAETDKVQATNNPDLHVNRATVHNYQEDYALAIEGFQLAAVLDPEWPEPKRLLTTLQERLARICSLIETKGRIKPKRLADILAQLKAMPASDGTSAATKYTAILNLAEGVNDMKEARVSVVMQVGDEALPRTYLGVDASGTWVCLTVYNINGDAIATDSMVVIPEPYFRRVKVDKVPLAGSSDFGVYEFPSIRVDNPVTLQVNGLPLGESCLAKAELRVETKGE